MLERIKGFSLREWLMMIVVFFIPAQTIFIVSEFFLKGQKVEQLTLGYYAVEMVAWLWVVLTLVIGLKNLRGLDKKKIKRSPSIVAFALLFLLLAIRVPFSYIPDVSWQGTLRLALVFIISVGLIATRFNKLKSLGYAFITSGALVSILGAWQFLSQGVSEFKYLGISAHNVIAPGTSVMVGESIGRVIRAYGSFAHPNVLGGFLALSISLSIVLFWLESNKNIKGLVSILSFFQVTGLLLTWSRSAWVAAGVFTIFHLYKLVEVSISDKKNRRFLLVNLFSFVCLVYGLLWTYKPLVEFRLIGESSHQTASVVERVEYFSDAEKIFKQNKFFGVGVGNYTAALHEVRPKLMAWQLQPIHFLPVLILVEWGVFGLGLLMLCFVFLLIEAYRLNKKNVLILGCAILPLIPLIGLDHYLYTSFSGLLMGSVFVITALRTIKKVANMSHS